jgi:hypothetical protein
MPKMKNFSAISLQEQVAFDGMIMKSALNNTNTLNAIMGDLYSLFRASGYFGQRIISLVIEAVKHSPFYI